MDELESLIDSLGKQLQDFLKEVNEGPSIREQALAFFHAVDWTEPWIILLIAFQVSLLLIVLLTRSFETLQFSIFIFGVLAVWMAEYLNAWAATHWKSFSRQNYFDSSGLFVSVVFSGPLMVLCIIILVQLMFTVVRTMYKWKRAELKHRARAAAKAAKADDGATKRPKEE